MSLPALPVAADTRSITDRVNVLIRGHNNPPAPQRYVPAGTVLPYAGSNAPTGFLFCQGQAVSRTTYADLFAAIGTTFGAGDGSTTFNLPNLEGRVPAGKEATATRLTSGVSGVDGGTLGATGGDQRMHQHTHGVTDPGHAHNDNSLNVSGIGSVITNYTGGGNTLWRTLTTGGATTGISIQNAGSGNAQNVQPTIVLNYVIAT
jgi:microcystin-dependent protein